MSMHEKVELNLKKLVDLYYKVMGGQAVGSKRKENGAMMELRDAIAIEVMKVILERAYDKPLSLAQADALPGIISRDAYAHADAMMKARGVDLRSMEDTMQSDTNT
jgi:hypothetical protein